MKCYASTLIAVFAVACGASSAEPDLALEEAEQPLGSSPAGDSAVVPEASATEHADAQITDVIGAAGDSAPVYGSFSAGHLKSRAEK
jgi:hypothetical protein